jgi:hypothetical protein
MCKEIINIGRATYPAETNQKKENCEHNVVHRVIERGALAGERPRILHLLRLRTNINCETNCKFGVSQRAPPEQHLWVGGWLVRVQM